MFAIGSLKINEACTFERIKANLVFTSKGKIKSARKLNTKYKDIKIKQHSQVTCLGCVLNETLSGNLWP